MSQDYQDYKVSTSRRRRNRVPRNRPVLVTNDEQLNPVGEETLAEEGNTPVESSVALAENEASGSEVKPRRSFFSRVGKREEEATSKEDVSRARLARATRGKAGEEATGDEKPKAAKPTARPRSTPPAGGFKTRWIIGMAIYLLAANFVGLFEQQAVHSLGIERQWAKFNLFGLPMNITTSTALYLATLVILLVVLARYDFIPRSLGGSSAANNKSAANKPARPAEPRAPQPTIRQGVSGEADDLYHAYRSGQRRAKKR
ncbi:hypothetical protein KSC_084180 [Ktedonobacter sp. SOSP1-52]|uniref:hypothetical protein n=1 Tax=Ktedonobacter sp. SOSP1-52 TaxID=2778366 RepID=UPI00191617AC|nr:hypothetical protein [Ktedonobacter sp. SOSP1-52]GHO69526.1 hypothetical protein KSC_084180 [Ktedonobacter sp. SOSP1-52]